MGTGIGALSTLLGMGGGTLTVPLLVLQRPHPPGRGHLGGARLAHALPVATLRRGFAAVVALIGVRMLV